MGHLKWNEEARGVCGRGRFFLEKAQRLFRKWLRLFQGRLEITSKVNSENPPDPESFSGSRVDEGCGVLF
jgi:hypothetical protein